MSAVPYKVLFADNIHFSITTAANVLAAYPASATAFVRLGRGLKTAQRRREKYAKDGVEVPPLMIVSTTEACNLSCAGCYAWAQNRKADEGLSEGRIAELLDEASELGVSIVMLAGGEPLLSHGWLEALGKHDELVGIVFTNGTLFDESSCAWFTAHRHVLPVFSIEGDENQTDARRGRGVYAKVGEAMRRLSAAQAPFGISVTVTSQNIEGLLQDAFIEENVHKGCRLFVFVEYVPVERDSEPLTLSMDDKKRLNDFAITRARKYPALLVPFPGDEGAYGGCLAAGRGFVHVSARGDVEPCPFAPFSDTNLQNVSLQVALTSGFLAKVRQNHHLLKEGEGGCALWRNREWLQGLV